MVKSLFLASATALVIVGLGAQDSMAAAKSKAAKPAQPVALNVVATRRLTETQYRHTIADLFGSDIQVNGRFEPERREEGLLAIGGSQLSISASGFEQYYAMARGISDQVLN